MVSPEVSPEELFGTKAGDVWRTLHDAGSMSVDDIARKTKLPEPLIWAALGWLGREGKLRIVNIGRKRRKFNPIVELVD